MSECHVMLSYQWDSQDLVDKVYHALKAQGLRAWMDVHGGVSGNINDSMAEGVDNAGVVCCFMTQKYSDSKNCKKELNYADAQDVPIVPVMVENGFKAKGWLGVVTAGLLWINFRDPSNFSSSVESLAKEIMHAAENDITLSADETKEAEKQAPSECPTKVVEKKPGRAFRHKLANKFLAESGQVKFHPQSGSRSTLVLRDNAEATSYWVEEKQKKSEIVYYKNYDTNGYLGYDPNGDYIYTKGQHYGAEEWLLKADEQYQGGERAVVLFANFGKKYLAIRNGKLTGVNSYSDDCVWILE
ncbi:uncharacterized protein LOC110233617 [Exaiptasia diaphana]|uniref:TIR domain-containing protein n=1 Tax=Exaiptasia diaphana TaxID=2652724 RepID=A0A913WV41_EXADI|nr:uncharacterized protein LOC110233617 [Exaiptasia diaphana]KXJ27782.1 hypothetical protein AC249_AIPGENE9065 [Exaiptasia diaphana]